jgi:asparagine synthase (glutamine-hydrolysing)
MNKQRIVKKYAAPALRKLAEEHHWIALFRSINQMGKALGLSRRKLLVNYGFKQISFRTPQSINLGIVASDFAAQFDLVKRVQSFSNNHPASPLSAREEHYNELSSGYKNAVLELIDRAAAPFALEHRHPFMDKRLIEYCLALPSAQKIHPGRTRYVMHSALKDILPPQLQQRVAKSNLSHNFLRAFLQFEHERLEETVMLHKSSAVDKYLNAAALQAIYQRFVARPSRSDVMDVWDATILDAWLARPI